MRFPENPAVRAQSFEAAADVLGTQAITNIREGLGDAQAGVRFAACMALGRLADRSSAGLVRRLVNDPDASVRVAAYYALERMGDYSYRRAWADALREDPSPAVRRNAAMALGLLGNVKAKGLLSRAAGEDTDDGVRLQATEAMALLGDEDARSRFVRDAFGGMGYRQPFALMALGHINSTDSVSVLRSRLYNSPYLEAKLAAARGLAMHGSLEGFELALQSLTWNQPQSDLPDDSPENQIMRVRTMAAMALGEMRSPRALPTLDNCMENTDDPRIQVAAARAILSILKNSPPAPAAAPASQPATKG